MDLTRQRRWLVTSAPIIFVLLWSTGYLSSRIIRPYVEPLSFSAIRFAAAVPGMMPRDAMLLISIHRRSVRGLALESPAALHRDLLRFAESTNGRLQLRGRRVPSLRRLKRWIAECESSAVRSPLQTRAA